MLSPEQKDKLIEQYALENAQLTLQLRQFQILFADAQAQAEEGETVQEA